ncbi:MAG: PqqD family protein [Acidimicrobiales bacterium]
MRYAPHPNVVARDLDGSTVLVHLDTSRIFTLNPTGSRVWELLAGPAMNQDLEVLERMLRETFDVDGNRLHREVVGLLTELVDERLVIGGDGDAP